MVKKMKKRFVNRTFLDSVKRASIGLWHAIKTEKNYFIYFINVVATTAINICLGFSAVEWLIYFLTIAGVFSAECFNTAIEHLCDIVCNDYSEIIKNIKDIASAGVLCFGIAFYLTEIVLVGVHLFG